jgi:hypothetical protein
LHAVDTHPGVSRRSPNDIFHVYLELLAGCGRPARRWLGAASLWWFVRQLRSMPNTHNPDNLSFTTIEEAVGRNDHLTVGELRKLGNDRTGVGESLEPAQDSFRSPSRAATQPYPFTFSRNRNRAAVTCTALVETVEKPRITQILMKKVLYFQCLFFQESTFPTVSSDPLLAANRCDERGHTFIEEHLDNSLSGSPQSVSMPPMIGAIARSA